MNYIPITSGTGTISTLDFPAPTFNLAFDTLPPYIGRHREEEDVD